VSAENHNSSADPPASGSRSGWKEWLAKGLHSSGALAVMAGLGRWLEFDNNPTGLVPRVQRRYTPRFAILCYHRVGTGGVPLYSQLPTELFAAQMRYLKKNYRLISLDQLVEEMDAPSTVEPAVAVTFDDGYRGLYTEAFPVLQKYHVPATVFLTAGCIETGKVAWYDRIFLALRVAPGHVLELQLDEPRTFSLDSPAARMQAAVEIITFLRGCSPERRRQCCADLESRVALPAAELRERMLTWEQVRSMQRGGVAFGAHTMTHPVISRLSRPEMEWEIAESKRLLEERLGAPVRHFAFPFGKHEECGESAVAILARGGFKSAATTEWGLNSPGTHPFYLRRVQIGETTSLAMFAFQLNRLLLRAEFRRAAAPKSSAETRPQNAETQPQRAVP